MVPTSPEHALAGPLAGPHGFGSCPPSPGGSTLRPMTDRPEQPLPTAADVDLAAARLRGIALHTPLISSPVLDALTGGRVFLKAETLQRTGSFKVRGASNKLSAPSPA